MNSKLVLFVPNPISTAPLAVFAHEKDGAINVAQAWVIGYGILEGGQLVGVVTRDSGFQIAEQDNAFIGYTLSIIPSEEKHG